MSQIGHWDLDLSNGTLVLSDEIHAAFEIDRTHFAATYAAFLEVIHPDDRLRVHASYDESVLRRTPCERTYRVEAASGKKMFVTEIVQTLYDPNGRALRSIGTVHSLAAAEQRLAIMDDAAMASRRLAAIVESSEDAIISKDLDGVIRSWNRGAEVIFGYAADEIIGKPVKVLLPPDRLLEEDAILQQLRKGLRVNHFETVRVRKDKRQINVSVAISPILDDARRVVGASKVARDITERKRIEAMLAAGVQEKETLLREIHHRVKNNLQIISSLLSFQSKSATTPQDLAAFVDGQNRLKAMILVHDKLYRARSLSRIEFGDYVQSLANEVADAYRSMISRVALQVEVEPLELAIEVALPCGMLLTELMTNAYKYAFPDGRGGTLRVQVQRIETHFQLTVSDDGVGLPDSVDPRNPASFGMQLAANLALQLGASLHYERGNGLRIEAQVPISLKTGRT
jgi:PAS domain S-box-containing protein